MNIFKQRQPDLSPGRFGPPFSANHDFCESNYEITSEIVEFWNVVSCFPMCWSGLWHLHQYGKHIGGVIAANAERLSTLKDNSKEKEELVKRITHDKIVLRLAQLVAIQIFVVGVGSALFHGTLTRYGQISDELPMLTATAACQAVTTAVLAYDASSTENSTTTSSSGLPLLYTKFLLAVVLYGFFDFAVFIGVYAVSVLWLSKLIVNMVSSEDKTENSTALKQQSASLGFQAIGFYISGFLFLWLPAEVFACDGFNLPADNGVISPDIFNTYWTFFTKNLAHPIFHFTSAIGPASFMQLILCEWLRRSTQDQSAITIENRSWRNMWLSKRVEVAAVVQKNAGGQKKNK